MQNVLKDEILQVKTESIYINAVTLQKLHHTMVAALDNLAVVQNS